MVVAMAGAAACAGHGHSASSHAPLAQSTSTFELLLDGPAERAFPLFGPVREAEWARGWAPRFLFPKGGAQSEGTVFTTAAGHGGHGDDLWVLTEYEPAAGRIGYVVTSPGVVLAEIKIRVAPAGGDRSRATVTYRRTALSPGANEHVSGFTHQWEESQRVHWEHAINAALDKERGRD
jgi:hypothetical protein